ncbi:MAG TPA: hypothetical protein VFC54_09770 [Pseudolabrys sp.]|nr:hypothetical protein [Pseudolabrys sp.]
MSDNDPKKRADKLQADPLLLEGQRGPRWSWVAFGLLAAIAILAFVTVTTGTHQMTQQPVTSRPPMTTGSGTPTQPVVPSGRTTSGSIPATPAPEAGKTPPPSADTK